MKTFLTGIVAATVLCATSLAQDTPPPTANSTTQEQPSPTVQSPQPAPQQSQSPRIAPGTVIPVQLTKTIDAKKAKTGDQIEAKVTQDLKTGNGQVVVPKDTKVLGRVTEAQARSKEQKESEVSIAFDRAVMKDSGEVPLPMSIQAIIVQPSPNSSNNSSGESSPQSTPSPGSGMPSSSSSGRPSASGGTAPQTPATPSADSSATNQGENTAHQPITRDTQGVVGISNLKLSTAADTSQGSVLSSEKNNVKLESGTFMLLRVNQ